MLAAGTYVAARTLGTWELHLLAYALAARRILCKPVKEVVLCFVAIGKERGIPVTEALLHEAAERVSAGE